MDKLAIESLRKNKVITAIDPVNGDEFYGVVVIINKYVYTVKESKTGMAYDTKIVKEYKG